MTHQYYELMYGKDVTLQGKNATQLGAIDDASHNQESTSTVVTESGPVTIDSAINPRLILQWLIFIAIVLTLVSVTIQLIENAIGPNINGWYTVKTVTDVDREQTIPTWFTSLLLAVGAALLFVVAYVTSIRKERFASLWLLLAVIFVGLSIDEQIEFHELFNNFRDELNLGAALYWVWVVPALALVAILTLLYWRMVFSLPSSVQRILILSAVLYVGGAVGVEIFGAWLYGEEIDNFWNFGTARSTGALYVYPVLASLEEILEMFGAIILIYGLLIYLGLKISSWKLFVPGLQKN